MGFRFRKSIKAGPVRINVSKSGVGYSVGGKGYRVTKKANGGTRTTYSIPGTGISYVEETSGKKKAAQKQAPTVESFSATSAVETPKSNGPKKPFYKRFWFWLLFVTLLGSCGNSEPTKPEAENIQQIIEEKIAAGQEVSSDEIVPLVESVSPSSIKEQEVSYESNAVTVNTWSEDIMDTATLAIEGNESSAKQWLDLVEDVKAYSLEASELLKSCGIEATPVTINVLNNKNSTFVLLSVMDGVVITDFVSDLIDDPNEETEAPPAPAVYDNPVFHYSAEQPSTYVLNTNTGKFHRPSCSSISDMDGSNKSSFTGTRSEIITKGYSPCGHCDP